MIGRLATVEEYVAALPAVDGDLARDVAPYCMTNDTTRLPLDRPISYELVGRGVAALPQQRADGG